MELPSFCVAKSGAPVIPIRIFGTYEAYGRHRTIPRPRRVQVKFGEALDFKELRDEAAECNPDRRREIYQEISEELMVAVANLKAKMD